MWKSELLSRLVWVKPEVSSTTSLPIADSTFGHVSETLSIEDETERNKDKLDLAPNINFVSRNEHSYIVAIKEIFARIPSEQAFEWGKKLSFNWEKDSVQPQVSSENSKELLSRMPQSLIELSKLRDINYHLFGGWAHLLPVPIFNEDWSFSWRADAISAWDFPRKRWWSYIVYGWVNWGNWWEFKAETKESIEDDHPSRVLVWVSNWTTIFPTPIPLTVSSNKEAVYLYQIHVLLHEFFHTIDYPRRDPEIRSKILLEVDWGQFTFQDWWEAFEELILSWVEPECISSYADTYFDKLNEWYRKADHGKFTSALAEQICETFVAYQLNIISNNSWWTDFKWHSFWNAEQLSKYIRWESPAANLKWILMDKLCRAKVLKKD